MARDRLGGLIAALSGWTAGLCLTAVLSITALQVFCRYVLDAPLRWPEELSRLLFIWLAYGGCMTLPYLRQHLAIEFIYLALPARWRWALDLLADSLGLVFFAALAYGGFTLVELMAGLRLPALQWPMNLIFGFVALAAALQSYLYLVAVAARLADAKRWAVGSPDPHR